MLFRSLNKDWEKTQIKVFSRWCAKHLATRGISFDDVTEFSNGVKLINLLEIVGKEPIQGRWHKEPKNRYQEIENCSKAIDYVTKTKGIKLIGIGPDDIVDKNIKLTLGLTWSCINKFQIEDISVEEATARDALLIWCKKNTQGYEEVSIQNFSTSWSSGLAFCALINHFRPELLDYNALNKEDHTNNVNTAFDACRKLGITVFLDAEDLVDTTPDDKSVVTQVSEFFHFFASETKTLAMAEKIKKSVGVQQQIDQFISEYEKVAREYMNAVNSEKESMCAQDYEKTVPGVSKKLSDVIRFGRDTRLEILGKKSAALKVWAALSNQCKSHSRVMPKAPEGLEPEALGVAFEDLEKTQETRRNELTDELHQIQKAKIDAFDEKCIAIANQCEEIANKSNNLEGDVFQQGETIAKLIEEALALRPTAAELKEPYDELVELNLNTRAKYTIYSIQNVVEQLIASLTRITDQNQASQIQENNNQKINNYNEKAQFYVDEAKELKESLQIDAELEVRRDHFIAKQKEITEKREGVNVLKPIYEQLEQEALHLEIVNPPDAILTMYGNSLTTAIEETYKCFDEMVVKWDKLTDEYQERIKKTTTDAENLTGTFTEQKQTIENLTIEANAIKDDLPALDAPFAEMNRFNLQSRVKLSPKDVETNVQQLLAFLSKLTEENKTNLLNEDNQRRIREYNELAETYLKTAKECEDDYKAINGDLVERRTRILAKLEELVGKREKLTELEPHYADLEKDGLHLAVTNTPVTIGSIYADILASATKALNEIYKEMVDNYDNLSKALLDRIKANDKATQELDGDLPEKKVKLEELLATANAINDELPTLDAPFEELTEFKLNYRAKNTPKDVKASNDQVISQINHLTQNNEGLILERSNNERLDAYKVKAQQVLDVAKALDESVKEIDGTNEVKQEKLFAKQSEVEEKQKLVEELVPIYEDLEKDSLHLEIENNPSSITTFFQNTISHIKTLISEVDKAIATAKGLEISEEQLQEFRETFDHFDKDKNNSLEAYELNACLTAMGEPSTEEECKEIIKQYAGCDHLDFDSYAKFMLDRFSKAETADLAKEAFKALSQNGPIINDEQLARYFSAEEAQYLKAHMEPIEGGYDFQGWVDKVYSA